MRAAIASCMIVVGHVNSFVEFENVMKTLFLDEGGNPLLYLTYTPVRSSP